MIEAMLYAVAADEPKARVRYGDRARPDKAWLIAHDRAVERSKALREIPPQKESVPFVRLGRASRWS